MNHKLSKTLLSFFMITLLLSFTLSCGDSGSDSDNENPIATLTIDTETISIESNSTATITATAKKADGTADTITAVSSDPLVATVSVSGLIVTVTGIKAGSSTVTVTSGSGVEETCAVTLSASWHTVFEDDFNRTSIGTNWTLDEGDASTYNLDGTKLRMNQINGTFDDGPRFLYKDSIADNYIKISAIINTTVGSNMETFFYLRFTDTDNSYVVGISGTNIFIDKVLNGVWTEPASETIPTLSSNQDYKYEATYNNGLITFTIKNIDDTIIKTITATDSAPLPAGKIGFCGEAGTVNTEYVYIDNFKLEKND